MNTNPNDPLIDPNSTTTLNDHWTIATALYPNGDQILWLLAPDNTGTPGCSCPTCAPHDQVNTPPLPDHILQRFNHRKQRQ